MLAYGHVRASGLLACSLVTLAQSRLGILVSDLVLRPAEILRELSNTLRTTAPGLAAMDYFCAVYDLQKRWLSFGTAGQVLLYLQRPATGALQRLAESAGPTLGGGGATTAPASYDDLDLDLESGDRLIVCSVNAVEVKNSSGEAYGLDRFEEALRRHAGLGAQQLRETMLTELSAFSSGGTVQDDLTVVVAQFGIPSRTARS